MLNIGFFYAIGAAVTWGLVYALDQKILSDASPLAYLFITSLLTTLVLLPFLFFDTNPIKNIFTSRHTILLLIITSIILGALANFFIFSSIKILNANDASIIEIAYPFFVILFSYVIFRTTPNIYFFIGGVLMFVGSIIIIKFGS